MLVSLSIKNVVLIDELQIEFDDGLVVLTGETGAGKSILLDSLGLALGGRGDSGLIRPGSEVLTVSASFEISEDNQVKIFLDENDIFLENNYLILRRTLNVNGRSNAYINDAQVSIGLLREAGRRLVEIHGQFDVHGLLDTGSHLKILDSYRDSLGYVNSSQECCKSWHLWQKIKFDLEKTQSLINKNEQSKIFLRESIVSLENLKPVVDDEINLVKKRELLRNLEKIINSVELVRDTINESSVIEESFRKARSEIQSLLNEKDDFLNGLINAIDRLLIEFSEIDSELDVVSKSIDIDPKELQFSEERLFALRAESRKHNVSIANLENHLKELKIKFSEIESMELNLSGLISEEQKAKKNFIKYAELLSIERLKSARKLEKLVSNEFSPVKLEDARFRVARKCLPETEWSERGVDGILFEVSTNPGMPFGPINKIASGGELARFLLVIRFVLSDSQPSTVMIFDEVDSGIGGSTASAVGERLASLSKNTQVFVVTHSPQVAAAGTSHWNVLKIHEDGLNSTHLIKLDGKDRNEEIARMLSGANVTDEARAAAKKLIRNDFLDGNS